MQCISGQLLTQTILLRCWKHKDKLQPLNQLQQQQYIVYQPFAILNNIFNSFKYQQ
ncbi:UNKNOWN [Stylonychia lemnae]|uniref:Uncharacterized protein n=1 Tax=Stylonychia lemnae TaxID=5949 RepID=A0A078ALB9_STYLE|nr:UNKNOWN [Stylonychia lemnae]|eukprot:CDW82671.1 UNKNOWN [Stylonychia lemnae]